jgi:hypothetical protein
MSTDRYTRDVLLSTLEEMRKRVDSLALTFQDRGDAIRLATFAGRIASLRKLLRAVKISKPVREAIAEMCGDIHADTEREAERMEVKVKDPSPLYTEGLAIGSKVRRASGGMGVGKIESFHKRIVGRELTFDARIEWVGGGNTLEPVASLMLAEVAS